MRQNIKKKLKEKNEILYTPFISFYKKKKNLPNHQDQIRVFVIKKFLKDFYKFFKMK